MTRLLFHIALAALSAAVCAAQAQDDPRDKLMPRKDGMSACFRRDYDAAHLRANPAQATQSILVSLKYEDNNVEGLELRVMMKRKENAAPYYARGGCDWSERKDKDLHPQGARILGAGRHSRGLDCIMVENSSSARESGYFSIDFSSDLRSAVVESDPDVAVWYGPDRGKQTQNFRLGRQDMVFRLTRIDAKACAALETWVKY
jgi:hypothetical protein